MANYLSTKTDNFQAIINKNNSLLSVKDILKEMNYNYNDLYIDKFWDNIKNDKWIYIDNTMLIWMGYNNSDNRDNKKIYTKLLENNFEENIDFKLINNKEFNNTYVDISIHIETRDINTHNKTKHLIVSTDCFKQSLMLLRTTKSKEIKKYYIELEKIFKFYLEYQNQYQQKLLKNKDDELQNEINTQKFKKHKLLMDKFNNKPCVYIFELEENNLIKIGSSNQLQNRYYSLRSDYKKECILLDVFETKDNREVENLILRDENIKQNLYTGYLNKYLSKEIIQLSDKFNYNQLISTIYKYIKKIKNHETKDLLEQKSLEIKDKKLNIIDKLLEKNMDPNLINTINFNSIDNKLKEDIKFIKQELLEIKQFMKKNNNIENNNEKKETVEVSIPNLNSNFNLKENYSGGKSIQKIDSNNIKKVIKVYNNMISLLRSEDCNNNYYRSGIYDAIKNNTLYKGYRWDYVKDDKNPYVSNISPTVEPTNKIKKEPVLKLDLEKSKIISVYISQKECAKKIGIGVDKLRRIIKNHKEYNNNNYLLLSSCPTNIIDIYNKDYKDLLLQDSRFTKPIIQTNPLNNSQIIFNSINDIHIKLGFTEHSIRNAIKNKQLYGGCHWEYKK